MSGPKVVRVVTREELVATCIALLRQFDRAAERWKRECERLGNLDQAEMASFQKIRESLAACLVQNRFAEIQQRVPAEIAFLSRDIQQRCDRAAEAAASALQQARQQRENAAFLARELRRQVPECETAILAMLDRIAKGASLNSDAEAILAKGFMILTDRGTTAGLTDTQRNLAKQLAPSGDRETFDDWKRARVRQQDARLISVELRLSEIEAYLGTDATTTFAIRLRAIESEPHGVSTNMRIDALILDLVTAVRALKEGAAIVIKARELADDLAATDDGLNNEAMALRVDIERLIDTKDFAGLAILMKTGGDFMSALSRRNAAAARRQSILSGLSALGYELREGMATAWAEGGRVVLRKPALPGYGLELAGPTDVTRLQVRAVAFQVDRNTARDREVETEWCGDFSKLQGLFVAKGGSITIEKALGIGETPLKLVENPGPADVLDMEPKISSAKTGYFQ